MYCGIQERYIIVIHKCHVLEALASHQCGPGSISRLCVICGLSLLVLSSALRGFSPGTPVFPSPQKPAFD